jgi:integrase/recombinase XerD
MLARQWLQETHRNALFCRKVADCRGLRCRRSVEGMTNMLEALAPRDDIDGRLRRAVVAYLGRYTGVSRLHTESDLRLFFGWCAERSLAPLTAQRAQIELYLRWMQEVRRVKPSTVSRRMAVMTGFYRTCVIDAVLEHSPADYLRRPNVPAESPPLGLSHLQFEALLSAARESTNPFDFALVVMLGLLGLRIFEATEADIEDVG